MTLVTAAGSLGINYCQLKVTKKAHLLVIGCVPEVGIMREKAIYLLI